MIMIAVINSQKGSQLTTCYTADLRHKYGFGDLIRAAIHASRPSLVLARWSNFGKRLLLFST